MRHNMKQNFQSINEKAYQKLARSGFNSPLENIYYDKERLRPLKEVSHYRSVFETGLDNPLILMAYLRPKILRFFKFQYGFPFNIRRLSPQVDKLDIKRRLLAREERKHCERSTCV